MAAAFADSLAKKALSQGVQSEDLFIALAGLICARVPQVGSECLKALDAVICASAGTCVPPA